LFSGIGGFDLGLEQAGFEIAWQAEIEPFPAKVLAHHWPEVRNYGDVSTFGLHESNVGGSRRDNSQGAGSQLPRHVDLICGGFPCQDLSVAGKRAGLDGARSGLWFEFHRILSELRPAFCLIENVPGLLSSNSGRDFGIILAGLGELWPAVGWVVLDSQHFGVPQRRRRVYVIAGPSARSIQQVLSLCESGDWHPEKGRETGEDVAVSAPLGSNATGGFHFDLDHDTYIPDVAWALQERDAKGPDSDTKEGHLLVTHTLSADGFDASEDGTGRGTPLVFDETQITSRANYSNPKPGAPSHPLAAGARPPTIAGAGVRRLTPTECLRLQGFPDDWCDIAGASDGAIYRAAGNAVTVPVIQYIGTRLLEVMK
jgi:DNA (cytosine-5)-methyltransferase 1